MQPYGFQGRKDLQSRTRDFIDREEDQQDDDDDDDDDNHRGLTELVRDVVGEIFRSPLVPELQL